MSLAEPIVDTVLTIKNYLLEHKSEIVKKIPPQKPFVLDISEDYDFWFNLINITRLNFKNDLKLALIEAICESRTNNLQKREKLTSVFNNITIKITIPENVNIDDLSSSKHEDKVVTFSCEVGTISKSRNISVLDSWFCPTCQTSTPLSGGLSKFKCGCGTWMIYEKMLKGEDIQRILLRQSLADLKKLKKKEETLREIEADLHGEYVNKLRLGESIIVTGIYRSIRLGKTKGSDHLINLPIIDIINIESFDDTMDDLPTSEELDKFNRLNSEGKLIDLLIDSFAFHIKGKRNEKFALLLALVGGNFTKMSRNRIHVLLAGDPSGAKSELAEYVTRVSNKSRYTDGTGSSKAGLLAGYITMADGTSAISPGPVVKCDLGHVVVDEFEKMKAEDKNGMLQFMEKGFVTRSLSGEDYNALARTTLIATMNPIGGKWDKYNQSIAANLDIQPQIFSRFDLKFRVSLDETREERQEIMDWMRLTKHGKLSWMLTDDEIRRYLNYVRRLNPTTTVEAEKTLDEFYHLLRDINNDDAAIDWRNYGALYRIATAIAKLLMKKEVDEQCANWAINLYNESLKSFGVDPKTGMTESSKSLRDDKKSREHVLRLVVDKLKNIEGYFFEDELIKELKQYDDLFKKESVEDFIKHKKRTKELIETNNMLKFSPN
jgi:DNA replicative helicase MCM subunit Mcm2 (Cdc46/Mcm family)